MFVAGKDTVIFNEVGMVCVRVTDPVIAQRVQTLPFVQVMHGQDQMLAMLPWTEDGCRLFQNTGLDMTASAPFWHKDVPLIEGKYKPMLHQLFTASFMTLNPRCYILSDPRTGKTGSFILGMDYMQKQRQVTGGVLIITTVTTMHGVWHDGIMSTLPDARVEIVHGKNRDAGLNTPAEWYITNYDSVRLAKKQFIDAAKAGRIGAVGIDEMTHIGNPSSQRHKAIDDLCNKCGIPIIVGLTGSPGENAETVFGMARVVNRHKLPCTTKGSWVDMVTFQYGPEPFMRRMSAQAPKIIHDTLQPAVRFNKKDIIDLPPVVIQDRECGMSAEQVDTRNQFKQQAVALLQSGEAITAANAGVLANKLLQVAQGFVIDNDGVPRQLDYTDRLRTIKEVIAETTRKVVIFCTFKYPIRRLEKDLQSSGYSVGVVTGDVTGKERANTFSAFQEKKDPRILIAHVLTTAYGVELSAADTIIYAAPPLLGGFVFVQSLERLSSMKQTADKISIIRIVGSPEEKRAYNKLDAGHKAGVFINSLFEDYAKGVL